MPGDPTRSVTGRPRSIGERGAIGGRADDVQHGAPQLIDRCSVGRVGRFQPEADLAGVDVVRFDGVTDHLVSIAAATAGTLAQLHSRARGHAIEDRPGGLHEAPTLRLDLVVHPTDHATPDADDPGIQDVFRAIVEDDQRTEQIGADIANAVKAARNCLVLSQWTAHIDRLVKCLEARGYEPLVLQGGMGKKARAQVVEQLERSGREGGILLIATGSFLGEGFDCPPLDTLFLTFPLAFKGRLVQYVGRVLRQTETKSRVEVHDYVDVNVPVLARMHAKRLTAYAGLGFDVGQAQSGALGRQTPRLASRSPAVAPGEFRL